MQKRFMLITLVFISLFVNIADYQAKEKNEVGSEHSITSCKDLESIGKGLDYPGASHSEAWLSSDNYLLSDDVDCSETNDISLYGEDGFDSIDLIEGNFNGNGFSINNLYSNDSIINEVSSTGIVEDLTLNNLFITGSNNVVGGLVSHNKGQINDVGAHVDVSGLNEIGGLVGSNDGQINDAHVSGLVNGDFSGGLAGSNDGSITNSSADVDVLGDGYLGGLVGYNYADISNSYATGDVIGLEVNIGGLVGYNYDGIVTNCYATGDIVGDFNIGGLIGRSSYGQIKNSYATGNITGGTDTGGLIGISSSIVTNSFATGDVSGVRHDVGGLIGDNNGQVVKSYRYDGATIINQDNDYGQIVSKEDLYNPIWYTDVLQFDQNWEIDSLVNQGYYPHVKNNNLLNEVEGQEKIELPQ